MMEVLGQLLGFGGVASQPLEAAGSLRCWRKTSPLVAHPGLSWPSLRTAADTCEIIAPSARMPLSAPEPRRVQLMIPAIPSFLFLLYSLFYTSVIWRFVCTHANGFNLQTFWMLSPRWVQQDRLCRQTWGLGKTSGLGHGLGLWEHMHCSFCGKHFFWYRPNVATQRYYITVLAAFMYIFPLFGMLFCVFQGPFCGVTSIPPSWTKAQFIPRCLLRLVILCGDGGIAQLGTQAEKRHSLFIVNEKLKQLLRGWRLGHRKKSEQGTLSS